LTYLFDVDQCKDGVVDGRCHALDADRDKIAIVPFGASYLAVISEQQGAAGTSAAATASPPTGFV